MASSIWYSYVVLWLFIHVVPFVWWGSLIISFFQHFFSSNLTVYDLYSITYYPLIILQSIQWIQILHTITKLTLGNLCQLGKLDHDTPQDCGACRLEPPDIIMDICKIGSRFNTLLYCLLYAWPFFNPSSVILAELYCNNYISFGYIILLFIWSFLQTIKYPFYIAELLEIKLSLITWIKFNSFWILIPIEYVTQTWCWYQLISFLNTNQNINNIDANYLIGDTIQLYNWCWCSLVLTPFMGAYVYYGFIASKRNYVQTPLKQDKKD